MMWNRIYFLCLCIFCLLISCGKSNLCEQFEGIETLRIDRSFYKQLHSDFEADTSDLRTSLFLGGLTPKVPIERIWIDCRTGCDKDWQSHGMMCGCHKYVILKEGELTAISNKEEAKNLFAPIDSYKEALSYVILVTRNFPVFDKDFFKEDYYYFVSDIRPTNVQETEDGYYVRLFDYRTFGCGEHPYYVVTYFVQKDGTIKEKSGLKAFKDRSEDSLCRD